MFRLGVLGHLAACLTIFSALWCSSSFAGNPIIPNKGVNDPHIRIFNDKAYLFASHDKSVDNPTFIMEDWWIWSSDDLVNWELESVLKPEDTYIGKPFTSAWATDAAYVNGKYYFYYSEGNHQAGVAVSDSIKGPWQDPLGKPFLHGNLTPTHEYDISIFKEGDDYYVVFGVWHFYIAKLNPDMITLAETPRPITINNPIGPYGEGTTDDKPFLHKYNNKYYLSWVAFYAVSNSLYGPYEYVDRIMKDHSFAPGYKEPTWPMGYYQGRHGSFFEWHNQWYFAYCDISQSSNRYFRDTFISYVHYREDGSIAPIRVDGIGVGEYDSNQGSIQAEDYFKALNFEKIHTGKDRFSVKPTSPVNHLVYQYVRGLDNKKNLYITAHADLAAPFTISVLKGGENGEVIAKKDFKTKKDNKKKTFKIGLPDLAETETIAIKLGSSEIAIDELIFK